MNSFDDLQRITTASTLDTYFKYSDLKQQLTHLQKTESRFASQTRSYLSPFSKFCFQTKKALFDIQAPNIKETFHTLVKESRLFRHKLDRNTEQVKEQRDLLVVYATQKDEELLATSQSYPILQEELETLAEQLKKYSSNKQRTLLEDIYATQAEREALEKRETHHLTLNRLRDLSQRRPHLHYLEKALTYAYHLNQRLSAKAQTLDEHLEITMNLYDTLFQQCTLYTGLSQTLLIQQGYLHHLDLFLGIGQELEHSFENSRSMHNLYNADEAMQHLEESIHANDEHLQELAYDLQSLKRK